jgi:hypothetical protein
MNPDSRIDGRKKKNVICIACSWFCAIDENVRPERQIGRDEKQHRKVQHAEVAVHRDVEDELREDQAPASPG